MKAITIAIGADHRGFAYKKLLRSRAIIANYFVTWNDVGTFSSQRVDYPLYAQRVVKALQSNEAQLGILLCGSGAGMTIAANRCHKIFAAVAWNAKVAAAVRADDHVNILVIPADFISARQMMTIVQAWLQTRKKTGRYETRLALLEKNGK